MTKSKGGALAVLLLAGALMMGWFQQRTAARLRAENEALRREVTRLATDHSSHPPAPATAPVPAPLPSDRLRELLRLRSEVARLRGRTRELEGAAASRAATASGSISPTAPAASASPTQPGPFQIQLVLDGEGTDTEPMTNAASGGEVMHVQKTPLLDQTAVQSVTATVNPDTGSPVINVEFSDIGRELFAAVTRENLNKRLAIVLNGRLYAAPVIRSEITGGQAQLTGSFTPDEALDLAEKIRAAIAAPP